LRGQKKVSKEKAALYRLLLRANTGGMQKKL
jgi:hypothetical protein